MADGSKIEWTEASWNPVVGCTKVSAGCDNCYAMGTAHRNAAMGSERYLGTTRIINARPQWTGVVKFVPEVLDKPLHWRAPRKIFVNSMSDLFHVDVKDEWIDKIFAVMALSPQHIFQILTKRPDRMKTYFSDLRFRTELIGIEAESISGLDRHVKSAPRWPLPLKHVHLGVSVEDQNAADLRIPFLLNTPAAVRWLSCEPILGPVDLEFREIEIALEKDGYGNAAILGGIDWVVVGGESGSRARPMEESWARSLREQCAAAEVAFFMKQGSKANWPDFKNFESFPKDLQVREYPNQ